MENCRCIVNRELHAIVICLVYEVINCAIIQRPLSTGALVGKTVSFQCVTNISDQGVDFMYVGNRTSEFKFPNYIYSDGKIVPYFEKRFVVENPQPGHFVLTVNDAKLADNGTIACRDQSGSGEKAVATLSVVECSPCDVQTICTCTGDSTTDETMELTTSQPIATTCSCTLYIFVVVIGELLILGIILTALFALKVIQLGDRFRKGDREAAAHEKKIEQVTNSCSKDNDLSERLNKVRHPNASKPIRHSTEW